MRLSTFSFVVALAALPLTASAQLTEYATPSNGLHPHQPYCHPHEILGDGQLIQHTHDDQGMQMCGNPLA
ncbi:hypothetical protein [[Erwinia] mediterraneensis]|uniref:hypothetical protein n=1 Tax=[Erwinia] mediterraneensis TaxID=2161819 RepID=UPI0010302075|nr:hypothetical protein [[Erwinia] mediterraneensis]